MKENIIPYTQEELHEIFEEREPGILYWKKRVANIIKLNKPAGHTDKKGYTRITINKTPYLRHRIIWKMYHGCVPQMINHIKGTKYGDNINNLEETTYLHNNQNNRKLHKNNTSGYKGVCWNKNNEKWVAMISVNNKRKYLGYFNNPEDAYEEYKKAKKLYHNKNLS